MGWPCAGAAGCPHLGDGLPGDLLGCTPSRSGSLRGDHEVVIEVQPQRLRAPALGLVSRMGEVGVRVHEQARRRKRRVRVARQDFEVHAGPVVRRREPRVTGRRVGGRGCRVGDQAHGEGPGHRQSENGGGPLLDARTKQLTHRNLPLSRWERRPGASASPLGLVGGSSDRRKDQPPTPRRASQGPRDAYSRSPAASRASSGSR